MDRHYIYIGPVTQFGWVIQERWMAETTATSEEKARSNLCYRWKREHNRTANAKIELPGKIYFDAG